MSSSNIQRRDPAAAEPAERSASGSEASGLVAAQRSVERFAISRPCARPPLRPERSGEEREALDEVRAAADAPARKTAARARHRCVRTRARSGAVPRSTPCRGYCRAARTTASRAREPRPPTSAARRDSPDAMNCSRRRRRPRAVSSGEPASATITSRMTPLVAPVTSAERPHQHSL